MESRRKNIIIFTASYPYGKKETYFDTELKIISQYFEKITIIPSYNPYKTNEKREVPFNVEVYCPIAPQGITRVFVGIFNLSPLKMYLSEFFSQKIYMNFGWLKKWFNSFLVYRILYSKLKKQLMHLEEDTILYSYWAEMPLFVNPLTKQFKKVLRMHGGDFYLNRNRGYLPLRERIYRSTDILAPISKNMANILHSYYLINEHKVFVNYLGVSNSFKEEDVRCFKALPILIVSCSNVIPLKRINLIIEALKLAPKGIQIEWHHFGDGPELKNIEEGSQALKTNVNAFFHGWTEPAQLFEFYKTNNVTWFINVSLYEGLPVSIMEAFSFGIPAIATDVGGTSEIVGSNNGHLLSPDFTSTELIDKITNIDDLNFCQLKKNAYNTWAGNFNAATNYKNFVGKILS